MTNASKGSASRDRVLKSVLDQYINTDAPLDRIIRGVAKPRPPILQALLYLEECIQGRRLARHAIEAAQVVSTEGSNAELLLLLLSAWAELSCRIGRPTEATALIERARPLVSGATQPAVSARCRFAEAVVETTTGNRLRCEQLMQGLLETLDHGSPRHKFYEWEYALFLAQQGRSGDLQPMLPRLAHAAGPEFDRNRLLLLRFVSAIETGDLSAARDLSNRLAGHRPAPSMLCRIPYAGYVALLDLLESREADASVRKPDDRAEPAWVRVARCLLSRQAEQALEMAREEAGRMLGAIFGSGFASFSLVRAELAHGTREGAMRLLHMREARGNSNYLDTFFFARAEWLGGNAAAASSYFAEALAAVARHGAQRRLDFELRMACELSRGDIVELTRSAEARIHRARYVPTPTARKDIAAAAPVRQDEAQAEDAIVAHSAAMNRIKAAIDRFAELDAPVLITGETGTGKEVVARRLHRAGKRKDAPFTAVNCAAISESLLESELFGHERGAFTGADKKSKGLFLDTGTGTILLDEIGDISPRLQSTLLRVLETGEIRPVGSTRPVTTQCRIIAATNADLEVLAREGRFRRDLLFRLQRLGIYVPPLRERPDDVIPLARHFLDLGRPRGEHAILSAPLVQALRLYEWPGNVRELKNVIERMRLMHSDKLAYGIDDLDLKFQSINRRAESLADRPAPAGADAGLNAPDRPRNNPGAEGRSVTLRDILRNGTSPLRRLARIRALFDAHGELTRSELIRILDVSPNTATKYLKQLCEEGYITRIEPSSSTRSHYFRRNGAPAAE